MAGLIGYAHGNARIDIDKIDPAFATALTGYFNANPGLGMYSGYRSIERQRALWEKSDKSGHMVARPGGSFHNFGKAADLSFNGTRLDRLPKNQIQQLHKSAREFGLEFPMSWEAWHVQPIGAKRSMEPHRAPASPQPPPANPDSGQGASLMAGGEPFSSPAPVAAPMPQPIGPMQSLISQGMQQSGGDWLSNTSYSGDAILSDLFRGQNPVKRFMYQKLNSLFASA